jgi:hypothetical protein
MPSHYDLKMPRVSLVVDDEEALPWGIVPISWQSAKGQRTALFSLAQFFRREFRYDFPQYSVDDREAKTRGYLWTSRQDYWGDNKQTVIGGCCFHWKVFSDAPEGYGLSFVWFHPYERQRGHLSRLWPHFKERFGDFFCEWPLSAAMKGFLAKHGDDGMGYLREVREK